MTDVCKKYRQGNCPHGRSGHRMVNGSSCLKPHPRTCFKYMKYGADQQRGCTQGLECNWFHLVICQTSLQKLRCKKEVCSLIHLYTARKAKKDNAGRFPSEHKSSQRSNGPSVGNSTRDRVKKDTKLTLMKEKDFLQALLNQQEQFLREMKDLKELVTQTRYQSPLTHPNELPAVQIPLAANQPQAHSSSADATTTGVEGEFTEDLSSIYLLNSQGTSPHASGNSRWKLPFIADNILQQKNIIRKSQLHQV